MEKGEKAVGKMREKRKHVIFANKTHNKANLPLLSMSMSNSE
jgi:hypothetical protein